VRRGVINERYGDIIEAIYADRPSVHVDTWITFQDGTKSRIVTDLDVASVDGAPGERRQAAE
jgi:long-chain acyl-CoA synthetase